MRKEGYNRVLDIHDNVVLMDNGSVFALFEIPSIPVSVADDEGKNKAKAVMYNVLNELIVYHHLGIFTLPMDRELFRNYKLLAQDLSEDTLPFAKYLLNGSLDNLEAEFGMIYEYRSFISVPLVDDFISSDISQVVKSTYKNARKEVVGLLNRTVEFDDNWYEEYQELVDRVENALGLLNPLRLSTRQTILVNRLQWLRGLSYDQEQEINLVENSIDNLDEGLFSYPASGVCLFRNEYSKSYVKFLPLSELPNVVNGLHFVEALQTLNFPVEILTTLYFNKQRGAFSIKEKGRRAKGRLKQNTQEAAEKDSQQKGSVVSSIVVLEDLEDRVDANETFLSFLSTLVITGQTIEEVKAKQDTLVKFLIDGKVKLSSAMADQCYLMYKNLLGAELTTSDKNWIQPSSFDGFDQNLYFVTKKLGVDVGFYLGRVDDSTGSYAGDTQRAIHSSSNFVFSNLLLSNKLNVTGKTTNNPHTGIVGATGGGKSFLTKNLFVQSSLLKSQVLYIDPKAEMRRQFMNVLEEYQEREATLGEYERSYQPIIDYIKQIHFVTLDARDEKNWGALDPLVYLTGSAAKDLLESMLRQISQKDFENLDFRLAFYDAVKLYLKKRADGEQVGTLSMLEYLSHSENENVSKIAKLYMEMVDDSILSLAFGDGSNSAVSMDNRITILEITGLDLPSGSASDASSQQVKSLALMYSLGYFCMEFGQRDAGKETVSFFDEAWLFQSSQIGAAVLKKIKRVGRSYDNFLVLTTQSVRDLKDENDQTSFGNVFAFLEPNEVDEVLEYLHVPVTDESRKMMMNMTTTGQCLYKDVFGRVARMTVDGMFPEVYKLFDTVKTELVATERVAV